MQPPPEWGASREMTNDWPSYQPRPANRSSSKLSRKSTPSTLSPDRAVEVPIGVANRAAAVTSPIMIDVRRPRMRVVACMDHHLCKENRRSTSPQTPRGAVSPRRGFVGRKTPGQSPRPEDRVQGTGIGEATPSPPLFLNER